MNNALKELMSFAEQSYIRLEAEHIIEECLASDSCGAFEKLLEELVLAGTTTLFALCEILEAIRSFKSQLGQEGLSIRQEITEAFDPPLRGMEEDLTPRMESYVKDWKILDMGTIDLSRGTFTMTLKALEMPGNSVMDFRLFLFERL